MGAKLPGSEEDWGGATVEESPVPLDETEDEVFDSFGVACDEEPTDVPIESEEVSEDVLEETCEESLPLFFEEVSDDSLFSSFSDCVRSDWLFSSGGSEDSEPMLLISPMSGSVISDETVE